jgi:hypothetical protein
MVGSLLKDVVSKLFIGVVSCEELFKDLCLDLFPNISIFEVPNKVLIREVRGPGALLE